MGAYAPMQCCMFAFQLVQTLMNAITCVFNMLIEFILLAVQCVHDRALSSEQPAPARTRGNWFSGPASNAEHVLKLFAGTTQYLCQVTCLSTCLCSHCTRSEQSCSKPSAVFAKAFSSGNNASCLCIVYSTNTAASQAERQSFRATS